MGEGRITPMKATLRARVLALLALVFLRPLLSVAPPVFMWQVRLMRAVMELFLGSASRPRGATVSAVSTSHGDHAVKGEWVYGAGVRRADSAILYLHGSAYVSCSLHTHRGLVAELSRASGLPVFSLDYRLAPEHRFPAAAEDVAAAYRWLLGQGYTSEQIVVAGDSAGGHLAVGLVRERQRDGEPQPAGLVLLSPLIDVTFTLAGERDRARRDPLAPASAGRAMVAHYVAGADERDIRLDLFDFDARGLPPMLVQAGGREMLLADSEHLQRTVSRRGGSCRLSVWPGQMHVFQALFALLPEAREAIREAGAWIDARLPVRDVTQAGETAAA